MSLNQSWMLAALVTLSFSLSGVTAFSQNENVKDGTWVMLNTTQISLPAENYAPGAAQKALFDVPGLMRDFKPVSTDTTLRFNGASYDAVAQKLTINVSKKVGVWLPATYSGKISSENWNKCGGSAEKGYQIRYAADQISRFRDVYIQLCVTEKKDGSASMSVKTMLVAGPNYVFWVPGVGRDIFGSLVKGVSAHIGRHAHIIKGQ